MKKFKLIKEYPSSPKLGAIVQDTNPNNGSQDAYFNPEFGKPNISGFILPKSTNPENYPEFWQEIKEDKFKVGDFARSPTGIIFKITSIDNFRLFGFLDNPNDWANKETSKLAKDQEILDYQIEKSGFKINDHVETFKGEYPNRRGNITRFELMKDSNQVEYIGDRGESNDLYIHYGNYIDNVKNIRKIQELTFGGFPVSIKFNRKTGFKEDLIKEIFITCKNETGTLEQLSKIINVININSKDCIFGTQRLEQYINPRENPITLEIDSTSLETKVKIGCIWGNFGELLKIQEHCNKLLK